MRTAFSRYPLAALRFMIWPVVICGVLAAAASAASGKQLMGNEVSLKDLQIKKRHLPKGWKPADKEQTLALQPTALFADPTIQGIAPKVAQKGTVSYAIAGSGTTTAYQLLYRDVPSAERALPLIMGFLWGPEMAPSPTRPASVLRCGTATVFVAGPDHDRVAKWLLGKYAKRIPCSQPAGTPLEMSVPAGVAPVTTP